MAINFPNNPSVNDTFTDGSITWTWDGTSWNGGASVSAESDPIFTASAASNVTTQKIAQWDAAYGWGDHANAGYLTAYTVTASDLNTISIDALSDVDVSTTLPSAGEVLSYDGSNWINTTVAATITTSDAPPSSPSPGNLWWESDTGRLKVYYEDVDTSQWVDASPPLANPLNVTAADATNWNTAYGWGDHAQAGYITSYTEVDTIATVVARGDIIGDDTSLKFGDAAPTQIYYDSTNNVTAFESNALIFRTKTTPNEDYITCLEGGAVEIYYDGTKKLGTTLAGVSVIGDLSASGDVIIPSKLIHDGDIDTYLSFDTDIIKLTTAGSERITIGSSGQLGLGGSNYGAAGEVLTSNGPTAAPSWQAPTGGGGGASSTSVDLSPSLNKPSIYPVKVPIDPDANGNSTYTRQSGYEWYGGALASNGNIYGTPYGSDRILKIDTATKTATTISVSGLTVNNQSYGGAVAHPNGKIYFTPMDEGNVLEFDPETEAMSTFGSNIPAYPTVDNGWDKGIVAPNGHIYCAPSNSNQVLKIDVTNKSASLFGDTGYVGILADANQANGDTGSSKFCGAHLVGDKIYLTPQSANDEVVSGTSSPNRKWIVGIIDTTNDTLDMTSFKFGESELPQIDDNVGSDHNGGSYLTGVDVSYVFQASVDGPDGKIYCIPYHYPWICVIDPIDNTISRMSDDPLGTVAGTGAGTAIGRNDRPGGGNSYESDFQFYGGTLAANGKIYCNRKGGWSTSPASNKILEIDPATQSWKYISQPTTLADGTVVDSTFWFPVTILGPDGAIYGIPYFRNYSGTGQNGGIYNLDDPLYWQPPAASLPAPWTLTINQNGVF